MSAPDRALTPGEIALAGTMFERAIDYDRVRIARRKWIFFQPRETVMAPMGAIHFHPLGSRYRDDFAAGTLADQGLFIHEMTHVWQAQSAGRWYLPLMRHPWCRYDYVLVPGKSFAAYGIEQQAEIVADAFCLRAGARLAGKPGLDAYEAVLPFEGSRA